MKKSFLLLALFSAALLCAAQVDAIKSSSLANSSGGERKSSGGAGDFTFLFIDLMLNHVIPLQRQILEKKTEIPELISLELRLQIGLQPATYYLALPRIRANWGLFSTDFRRSYLLESNPLGTTKDISWNDWQVLQLNLINTPTARFRIGGGIMSEVFNAKQTFTEYTMALGLTSAHKIYNGEFEFRAANDLATGNTPRWELNAHVNKKLFDRNRIHGFLSGGGVFQEYYGATRVWAFTAGMVFKVY
jgi:hypothetical protein